MVKISVIMGVYNMNNKRDQLDKAIDSIIYQSFLEWECLICDDGSSDGTWEYLKTKYNSDSRIKLIKHDLNKGLRVALNNCLKEAKGKYIVRHDADDYSSLDRFKILYNAMEKNKNIDVIGSNIYRFDEKGVWQESNLIENPDKNSFIKGSQVVHPSIIAKRESVLKAGGYRVDWETIRCEDYDLFMRMISNGSIFMNIKDKLYYFREDKDSYKRKKYKNRIKETVVRFKGYKKMGIPLLNYIYIFKPLIIGILPGDVILFLKKKLTRLGE